jgi:hypothetical protein
MYQRNVFGDNFWKDMNFDQIDQFKEATESVTV